MRAREAAPRATMEPRRVLAESAAASSLVSALGSSALAGAERVASFLPSLSRTMACHWYLVETVAWATTEAFVVQAKALRAHTALILLASSALVYSNH